MGKAWSNFIWQGQKVVIKFLVSLFLFFSCCTIAEERTIIHQGIEREFLVHIPNGLTEDSPIVFVMHGFTGTAEGLSLIHI